MRTDPFTGVCYELKAGQYITLFVRNAVFPTLSSLRFDITFLGEQLFFGDLLNGYLPYQGWSLTILDSAFHELGRYTWQQCQVTRVSFPDLENASASIVSLSVELFLTGLTEGRRAAVMMAGSISKPPEISHELAHQYAHITETGFDRLCRALERLDGLVERRLRARQYHHSFDLRRGGRLSLVSPDGLAISPAGADDARQFPGHDGIAG